ncbi:peptidase C14, caspase domain-containing protein, partial [Desarmillaria tabescens]
RQFWAVLIGIDAYPTTPLRGCVSDAREMAKYLIGDLGVPEDHIQYLLGNDSSIPTRDNIIKTLLGLSTDDRIRKGDNIIIYFAGKGSIYLNRDYFPKGTLEWYGSNIALCPVDRTTPHDNGVGVIPDISDREINIILSEIAGTKGCHITVILDCCHSSGATRG